jgi:putative redox protein
VAPLTLSLDWHGDMRFRQSEGSPAIELDSSAPGITSPPQALAYAVMACMGMDVLHVIRKQRLPFTAMRIRCEGERAPAPPRRFTAMTLHFEITGEIPEKVVARAIQLSRDTYCSVWNSIRPDVTLVTSFAISTGSDDGSTAG